MPTNSQEGSMSFQQEPEESRPGKPRMEAAHGGWPNIGPPKELKGGMYRGLEEMRFLVLDPLEDQKVKRGNDGEDGDPPSNQVRKGTTGEPICSCEACELAYEDKWKTHGKIIHPRNPREDKEKITVKPTDARHVTFLQNVREDKEKITDKPTDSRHVKYLQNLHEDMEKYTGRLTYSRPVRPVREDVGKSTGGLTYSRWVRPVREDGGKSTGELTYSRLVRPVREDMEEITGRVLHSHKMPVEKFSAHGIDRRVRPDFGRDILTSTHIDISDPFSYHPERPTPYLYQRYL